MSGPLAPTRSLGKLDTELRRGLPVATDTTRTQVWTARNRWEGTDTAAARAAGLAWPADSGLTWDASFSAWVASLAWIPSVGGDAMTVEPTTPWGKTLPAPMLECAETSLFLRISFAAWYELPLMLETQDDHGHLVYFGHNGVRTTAGRHARSPELAVAYRDYTGSSGWQTRWPSDPALRGKRIAGGDDDPPELAGGTHFGAYPDELHPRQAGRPRHHGRRARRPRRRLDRAHLHGARRVRGAARRLPALGRPRAALGRAADWRAWSEDERARSARSP